MKKLFYFFKFLVACACIFCMFPSCHVTLVNITGTDTSTGRLILTDAQGNSTDTLTVDPGQRIKWKIAQGVNVSGITALDGKPGNDNLFRKLPHKKFLSSSWKGRIEKEDQLKGKKMAGIYFVEDYFIEWKDNSNKHYKYDPRILVKSILP